jgi:hypothetical protein
MSAVSGLLTLNQAQTGEEWVSEYQKSVLVRNAKGMNAGATLFGLMSKLPNENAETSEYKWFERDPATRTVYCAADVAQAGTTLTLNDNAGNSVYGLVQVGTILKNDATGEGIRVTAYAGGNYTIERSFFGSAPAGSDSIANNATLTIITLGKDEGANPVQAVYEAPDSLYNYIQTFNSTVELSNAFKGNTLRTDIDGPLKERRVQALERIARDIELAYFFGVRAKKTGGTGNQYFTGGIQASVDAIGDSAYALNGAGGTGVAVATFKSWLETFMTQGSDAKLAFAGPKSYSALSNYANSATNGFRITGSETVYGMNIQTIMTPFGEISLAMHPLFKEITVYNDWMVVVDMGLLSQKVMEKLFLEPNIQTPGADAYKEQFRAKLGLKLKFAEAFGYAYDLQKLT